MLDIVIYVCTILVVCYQYDIFLNINVIGLKVLLNYLDFTKVAVYSSNRFIANLPPMWLNIVGQQKIH